MEKHTKIKYNKLDDGMIQFNYGGHSYTMCPDDGNTLISADDDCSFTLDPKVIIDIDEKKEIIYIEK